MNVPALTGQRIAIGEANYAASTRTLVLDGQEQRLEPRIAQLLETFCEHPGEVLEREQLLDRVWGDEGSDEALTQAVSRLRQLLGNRQLIQTEPRKGYRLTVEPRLAPHATRGEHPEQGSTVRREHYFTVRTVRLAFASGVALGLLLAALVTLLIWPDTVTVLEVSTQQGDGPQDTRTIRCEGDLDDCGGELEIE